MTTLELHDRSISLGNIYASLYRETTDLGAIDRALDAYIASRRALKRDSYTGRRYGAGEAFESTQGFNLEA
jgi:hypothetical protein